MGMALPTCIPPFVTPFVQEMKSRRMEPAHTQSRIAFIAGGSRNACGGWHRVVVLVTRATTSSSSSTSPSALGRILVAYQVYVNVSSSRDRNICCSRSRSIILLYAFLNKNVMSDSRSSPLVPSVGAYTDDWTPPGSSRLATAWLRRMNRTVRASLCCERGSTQNAESEYEVLIRNGEHHVGSNIMRLSGGLSPSDRHIL